MPDFFHVAPPGLRVGEIVQPGHGGRETLAFAARGRRGIQHDSDAINLIWEAALEAARLVRFPEPLTGSTAYSPAFGRKWRQLSGIDLDRIINSIELNSSILTHQLPLGITEPRPSPDYVEMAARIAASYWNATQPRFPEALIGGAVKVTAIVG
jgi:hypothetical protein